MTGTITILGCGSSGGVPRIGQGWGACDPRNPRNNRLRCSILIEQANPETGRTTVLVDLSPDLRQQLLGAAVGHLDAVVLTHPHADHTHGIDDVRPLVIAMRRRIEVHMDAATSRDVKAKFAYIFETPSNSLYPPLLEERRLVIGSTRSLTGSGGAIDIVPFELAHGEINALGLRIGDVAYTPDLNDIPARSKPFLQELDTWIVDALRYSPHPSHLSVREALEWIDHFRPRRAILTNLHCDLDYDRLRSELPPGVEPAYDGMQIPFG